MAFVISRRENLEGVPLTDKQFSRLHVSISKAINTTENPVKEKHVRSAILGTFHENSADTFWICVLKLPLQENRIAAWKFCHVLHKVLREGHPQVFPSSVRHIPMMEDLGKLWGHLKEGYGTLIKQYTKLLIMKIKFHRRNPRIPGHLSLTPEELHAVGDNDINNYFQLSVEMFDYMDEILALQALIFNSLDMSRSNSMTSCGQCRLAPLIPNILDSSQLYDTCVKILFKLHGTLPPDLLSGHRQRFLLQFKALRKFYHSASMLQYFKNLIQIPALPENPPNFLVQAELSTYVTPVVVMPAQVDDPMDDVGELVDLTTPPSTPSNAPHHFNSIANQSNGSTSPDLLAEKDILIEQLQAELARYKNQITKMITEHQQYLAQLNEKMVSLSTDLVNKEKELALERKQKQELLKNAEAAAKALENEARFASTEKKFEKLKDVYSKLREEHIQLIRQKADVDKQLAILKTDLESDENKKMKLEELAQELASLQATADAAAEQNQALETKIEFLSKEKAEIENEVQDLIAQKEDLDVRLRMAEQENVQLKCLSRKMFQEIVAEAIEIVERGVHEVDNPALSSSSCSLEYFTSLVDPLETTMKDFESLGTADRIMRLSHQTADLIILVRAASNTATDIELGEKMAAVCKLVGLNCVKALQSIESENKPGPSLESMRAALVQLLEFGSQLERSLRISNSESIGDLVESELAAMDKAIEEAARKIEEMLSQSRKEDSGIKLEVNEKILDSCTGLMAAIRILVQKAKILQAEIVAQGKGSASAKEFYKRNHQWTEGLISAAKAVGMGASYLLEAADKVVTGQGKLETVMVAVQEIAASTTQLVVASRVKADKNSNSLTGLTQASRGVTQATATVLASAKSCVQLVEQSEDLDLSGLTLYNAKRLEMEAQVKVLELESSLAKERLRLAALRRHHYALAPESDQLPPAP